MYTQMSVRMLRRTGKDGYEPSHIEETENM